MRDRLPSSRHPFAPLASLALPLLLAAGPRLAAQATQSEPDPQDLAAPAGPDADAEATARERSLDKTRQMLEQRPAHAALFDRYFKLLIQSNSVDGEIEELQKKLVADPQDRGTSIVLGRLLLRAGKEESALEVLGDVQDVAPDVQGVLGDIYLKLARFDRAARAFEGALDGARTAEEKRTLLEKLGQCRFSLGQKANAIATWRRIGELDGGKFYRRLRVAELLAEAGLVAEAAGEYAPLLDETKDDPERHCRVLRDLGRLKEIEGQLDEALEIYGQVFAQTSRGNWLRKEIEQRTVQIYRRTGRLEELAARLREQLQDSPDDLSAAELLAGVLTEMRDMPGAIEVLGGATQRFPNDVRLARRLAELHVDAGEIDAAIAEYQRVLSLRPDELELYLELGTLFARGERFNEAKNQWEKALAKNLTDASLCTRIASMYALWERADDAVRLYERAIELEPESMVRYTDLAAFLFTKDRGEDALAVLDRALAAAAAAPRRLETLAGVFREYGLNQRARGCFDGILAAEPQNQEARFGLAQLLLTDGDTEAAVPLLWQVVDGADKDGGYRTMAASTLCNLAARQDRTEALIADAAGRDTAGAAFVLGRAFSRSRDFDRAIDAYRLAIERHPEDIESRRLLARILADQGDFPGALEAYAQLGMIAPSERRRTFREVAQIHLETYQIDEAITVWQDAMRLNPDNASVFLQVGREFLAIQRIPEALDALRQAARLKPNDPDVRFRLAEGLQRAGRVEEAEAQLLEMATRSLDPRDREQARQALFKLYGEQGRIDERIEALRSALAENAYDKDSPQLLADLYLRTSDYVLGLQMIDRTLTFQPRNEELLIRRAELLEALEEWSDAYAAHEELLKFPNADRDLHLAGMGQAMFEMGKPEAAKVLFLKIQDVGRVSGLFDKYRLFDEATDYYRRAVARNPADLRSYVALAKQLESRNLDQEAIETLERALDIRPFYRPALQALGKLYVQDGRRDDAVEVGMRLFGLRGEKAEATRREEFQDEKARQLSGWMARYRYSQSQLDAAQQYFTERGLNAEWTEILVAEAKRRPTVLSLHQFVRNHFSWYDKSATKLAAFLTELLRRDFETMRPPPSHTRRSFREMVESSLVGVWQDDAAVADARLGELSGVAGNDAARERAVLLRCLGKRAEMAAELSALLDRDPDDAVARAMLVDQLVEDKDYPAAIQQLRRLASWWDGPGAGWHTELDARRAARLQQSRENMRQSLPRRIRRRVKDEDLVAVLDRTDAPAFRAMPSFSFPESVPEPFAILQKLVRLESAAGGGEGLDGAIDAAVLAASNIARKSTVATALFQENRRDRAEPLLQDVLRAGRALRDDPLQVYFWSYYRQPVGAAAESLAQILTDRGDVLDAYRLLTEFGARDKAELVLRQHDKLAEVQQILQDDLAAQADRLRAARKETGRDLQATELDYRDAVIKLADLAMGEKDFTAAEERYQRSLDLLPDDLEIRDVLARLRLRRGDAAAAIATREEIIDVKRRKKRAAAGDSSVPPTRLRPTLPDARPTDDYPFISAGPQFIYPWQSGSGLEVSYDYRAILQIQVDRNDHAGVLDTFQRLCRDDPTTFQDIAYEAVDLIQNLDLGKKKLPILRTLRAAVKGNEWLTLSYAEACREAGELQEARRCLEDLLATGTGIDDYYQQRARQELDKIAQRLGEGRVAVEELRRQVEAEPDNMRHRLKLAERLKKDHDYRACLAEAALIVDKAPYMTQAKEMVVEAAAALGDDDQALEMLRRLFDEATTPEDKVRRGVALANWLYGSDQKDEAFRIVETLETKSGGTDDFSPGNWFLDHHRADRALALYLKEVDKLKGSPWYLEQVRPRLARVEMATGHTADAIERYLDSIRQAGSLGDREVRFKELLAVMTRHPDPDRLYSDLEQAFGARETGEQLLVMGAAAFIKGDASAAEHDLDQAVEISAKEVHLFPLLLGLARLRGENDRALALLDRMERVYGGSDATQWSPGVSLSQRDRLKVERSVVLRQMGRADDADALLLTLVDETVPSTFRTVSTIFAMAEQRDKALEWRRRYAEKTGTKEKNGLLAEAGLLLDLDRPADALTVAREAELMARGDAQTREVVIRIHRELGKLAWLAAELEAELDKDPRDKALRDSLLDLYGELGMESKQLAIYRSLLDQPEEREAALNTLLDRAAGEGDRPAAIAYLDRLIELKGGEEKKRLFARKAALQTELGDRAAAEESFRLSIDLETADGLRALAGWLDRQDLDDRALEVWREVQAMDPDGDTAIHRFATAAWKAKEHRRALDLALDYLDRSRGKVDPTGSLRTLLLDSLAGLPEDERRELLSGAGDDPEAIAHAALLHCVRPDFEAAGRLARAALDLESQSVIPYKVVYDVARAGDDLAARLAAADALRLRLEQECNAHGADDEWTYRSRAEQLQNECARLQLALGRPERAVELWRDPPLRRASSDNIGMWRSDWQVRYATERWLEVGRPAEALRAIRDEFLMYEEPPWRVYIEVLRAAGSEELAEQLLRRRIFDPLEQYGVGERRYYWRMESRTAELEQALVDIYEDRAELPELRKEVEAMLAQPANEKPAESLLKAIAGAMKDNAFLAAEAQRELDEAHEKDPAKKLDRNAHFAIAQQWLRAKRPADALAHLRQIVDFDSPGLRRLLGPIDKHSEYEITQYGGPTNVSATNPFSFSFGGSSSGMTTVYSSRSYQTNSELDRYRRFAAALLFAAGERDQALEVEQSLLATAAAGERDQAAATLASNYLTWDVPAEAARLLRSILERERDPTDALKPEQRASYFGRLAGALREAGDDDARRAALVRQKAALEQQIDEAPGPHAFGPRSSLVDLLIELDRPDEALAQLETLEPFAMTRLDRAAQRARILHLQGRPGEAVALYRALDERDRLEGMARRQSPERKARFGLALADSGETDEARRMLTEAVRDLKEDSDLEKEVRTALAKLN